MNESEDNFRDLKHLLKLKRHEIPPPGFFNNFSDDVISRIRSGEGRATGSFAERLNDQAPWLVSFLRIFEAKPGVIGGFATSLCLMLLFGVVMAERSESGSPDALLTTASSQPDSMASSPALASTAAPSFASTTTSDGGIAISTNASLQPVAALFGQPAGAGSLFQPASFSPAH